MERGGSQEGIRLRTRGWNRRQLESSVIARDRLRHKTQRESHEDQERMRRAERIRRIKELQDALLLEISLCTEAVEMQREKDFERECTDIQRERQARTEVEEINRRILQGHGEEQRRKALEEDRKENHSTDIAERESARDVEIDEILADREREILAVAREIEHTEEEKERQYNMEDFNIDEVERQNMRAQDIEICERQIDNIEEEIRRIIRDRDRDRYNERLRIDTLVSLEVIDNIERLIRKVCDREQQMDIHARDPVNPDQVQMSMDINSIENSERGQQTYSERSVPRDGTDGQLIQDLDYLERLLEREGEGQTGEDMRQGILIIERLVEQDIQREQEMQRDQEREEQSNALRRDIDETDREMEIENEIYEFLAQHRRNLSQR